MLAGHETMLGLKKAQAGSETRKAKPKKTKPKAPEHEEWTGVSA
jgi:hypothetical protein